MSMATTIQPIRPFDTSYSAVYQPKIEPTDTHYENAEHAFCGTQFESRHSHGGIAGFGRFCPICLSVQAPLVASTRLKGLYLASIAPHRQ